MSEESLKHSGKVIYIRADGNKEIATGHLMRCLSIARACRRSGASVVFLLADSESEALLSARIAEQADEGITIMNLRTDYSNAEEELPLLCQILMSYPCSCLLIDSYFVNPGYLETLSRLTKVAYIDDVFSFPYPVHTIINYAPMAPHKKGHEAYSLASEYLLGISYAPVREMFLQKAYVVRPEMKKILLTAGGIHNGLCYLPILQGLFAYYQELPEIHLLLGAGENTSEQVKTFLQEHPQIISHGYIRDMASFLCDFDLVFAAAGTTLYELCALGIPTCSFVSADNQLISALDFAEAQIIPCMGHTLPIFDGKMDISPEDVQNCLFQFLDHTSSYQDRLEASNIMTSALDKRGADRICDALLG